MSYNIIIYDVDDNIAFIHLIILYVDVETKFLDLLEGPRSSSIYLRSRKRFFFEENEVRRSF